MSRKDVVVLRDLHGLAPPGRGRLDRFAYGLAVGLMVGGVLFGLGVVKAQEVDEERYTPSARGTRPAVTRWTDLVAAYDWDVPTALRVIDCESSGDPGAINPYSGAAGLFQLYGWSRLARRLFGDGRVLIPWVNVATAHALWEDSGERFGFHWYASRGCWGG